LATDLPTIARILLVDSGGGALADDGRHARRCYFCDRIGRPIQSVDRWPPRNRSARARPT
jgi:hypothetical protein